MQGPRLRVPPPSADGRYLRSRPAQKAHLQRRISAEAHLRRSLSDAFRLAAAWEGGADRDPGVGYRSRGLSRARGRGALRRRRADQLRRRPHAAPGGVLRGRLLGDRRDCARDRRAPPMAGRERPLPAAPRAHRVRHLPDIARHLFQRRSAWRAGGRQRDALPLGRALLGLLLLAPAGAAPDRCDCHRVPRGAGRERAPSVIATRWAETVGTLAVCGAAGAGAARQGQRAREPPGRRGAHRLAHRPAQPASARGARRGRDRARAAQRPAAHRRGRRRGPLQARERPARAPGGRQGARAHRRAADLRQATDRHGRPERGRGVHARAAGHARARRISDRGATADDGRAQVRAASSCRSRSASGWPPSPRTASPRRPSRRAPTRPCTRPSSSAATARSSTATRSPASRAARSPAEMHLATLLVAGRGARPARHGNRGPQRDGRSLLRAHRRGVGTRGESGRAGPDRRRPARHRQDRASATRFSRSPAR